jgi:parvulin-like peptidyl-prolyl isomerase
MLVKHPIIAVLAMMAGAVLAASGWAASDADVIAKAGKAEIGVEEIKAAIAALGTVEQAALANNPAALSQAVRTLVAQRLVLKEAGDRKWEDREEVKRQIERVREAAIVESYLQSVSKAPDEYPSDTELATVYEANKEALKVPRQLRLSQVFVAEARGADAAGSEKAKGKLADIKKALAEPKADFATVARIYSDEQNSASKGGEIGWLTEDKIQMGIRAQVTALAKDGVTEPVRLDDGWHIVKCLDVKESYLPTLEEIKEPLKQRLRAGRSQEMRQNYLARLIERNPVAINELALEKLLKSGE